MIVFTPFCMAQTLVVAGKGLRVKWSQLLELIGRIVASAPPTTHDIDELNVCHNAYSARLPLCFAPTRQYRCIQASTDSSDELPKKRRHTEFSVSSSAHRQGQFQTSTLVRTAGAAPELCITVRQRRRLQTAAPAAGPGHPVPAQKVVALSGTAAQV